MSKILGIIAAVVLAITALLAIKNKGAYEGKIDQYKAEQDRKEKTTKDLADEKQRIEDAKAKKEEYLAQKEVVESDLKEVIASFEAAEREVVSLEQDFKANEVQITEANGILQELPNPRDLVPKVKRMRGELSELNGDISTQEARLANLTEHEQSLKSSISKVRDLIGLQSSGASFPTMHAHISSIYPNLGFVTISAGDRQGVVTGSTLDVVRGGEVIGKLKVTAVEAGRASADIILNSVADDVTIRPHDTVRAEVKNSLASAQ